MFCGRIPSLAIRDSAIGLSYFYQFCHFSSFVPQRPFWLDRIGHAARVHLTSWRDVAKVREILTFLLAPVDPITRFFRNLRVSRIFCCIIRTLWLTEELVSCCRWVALLYWTPREVHCSRSGSISGPSSTVFSVIPRKLFGGYVDFVLRWEVRIASYARLPRSDKYDYQINSYNLFLVVQLFPILKSICKTYSGFGLPKWKR